MSKKLKITMVIVIVMVMVFCLVGCGGIDYSEQLKAITEQLKTITDEHEDLKNKNNIQDDKLNNLEARLSKVEATVKGMSELDARISELEDNAIDTTLIAGLRDDMAAVQAALLKNTTNDAALKTSVTAMQLQLDEIAVELAATDTNLSDTQDALNKLYGETVRIYDFQQDTVYEAKLNGVLYYSIQIYYEVHESKIVDNPSDVTRCMINELHACGRAEIKNYTKYLITMINTTGMIKLTYSDYSDGRLNFVNKDGFALTEEEEKIPVGGGVKWYLEMAKGGAGWKFETCSLNLLIPTVYGVTATRINNYYVKK